MKVLKTIWWGRLGIVLCEDERTGKRKGYVGIGDGRDQARDTQWILDYGCPLVPSQVQEMAEHFACPCGCGQPEFCDIAKQNLQRFQ